MQYHLNGYRPGDPALAQPAVARSTELPAEVDVLIVGCGPAGLTLAAQLSRFPEIQTRIVEQKDGPLEKGQADGISCRSMEMFQSFGFAHRVLQEAHGINETTFWTPDPGDPGTIRRSGRIRDVEDGLSDMPHMILNQARVHDMYLELMARSPNRLVPDYGCRFVGARIGTGPHPVEVTLDRGGQEIRVRAQYLVGCDGARSAVRGAIGQRLEGDSANQAWGVMDVLPVTDFPDIRLKTLIKAGARGTVMIIPREGGYLTRFYIELDKMGENERVRDRGITLDGLISQAQAVFAPYRMDIREVAWWSVYEIGQRLCARFDDGGAEPRVFICGDACHTHSPKAGQGMNVSMGDGLNLGWKLAAVLRGQSDPTLLRSYSEERHAVAQDLLDFDREWAAIMSERKDEDGPSPEFQRYFIQSGRYTAGVAVQYATSDLTGDGAHQALATGFPIGMRFHSAPVIRLADAQPMQLAHVVEADGRWRLFVFAGPENPMDPAAPVHGLCDWIAGTLVPRHTPQGADPDAVIDLRGVFQQGHRDLDLHRLPAALRPSKGRYGLTDYEKVFCPDPSAGDIHEMRGIDRDRGCVVIVRPDQYVAHILPLAARAALADFFANVLTETTPD